MQTDADELLRRVHAFTRLGVDISTFSDGGDVGVEVRWRREYADGHLSEERYTSGATLKEVFLNVLKYEEQIDSMEE